VLNDYVFPDGTPVKKGNLVMYSAYAMGRMEYIWGSDAGEFQPSRWLQDGVLQLESPFKFTVFQVNFQTVRSLSNVPDSLKLSL
jgi:cytochrome P450